MKASLIGLIILGILGAVFVCIFDIIVGKPVNNITGPKSISALILCGILTITGIVLIVKGTKKKSA